MAFRVNALRSQVHRTELQIISLRKEKLYLETEVETRANQQQLKLWNDVEFGYVAPSASQYIASERQLAAFAKPEGPDAPEVAEVHPDEECLSDNIPLRDKSPIAGIRRIIAIVAHHEIMARRHFIDGRVVVEAAIAVALDDRGELVPHDAPYRRRDAITSSSPPRACCRSSRARHK